MFYQESMAFFEPQYFAVLSETNMKVLCKQMKL